jgi:15-cis-phytoene synthase
MLVPVTDLLVSSSHHAASDSLKDADNLAFLADQPADVRAVWIERCRLLRWVDQLAESDRWAFAQFVRQWLRVTTQGAAGPGGLEEMAFAVRAAWGHGYAGRRVLAWSTWLHAIAADYGSSLAPVTLEQHDAMVEHVGGFFRLFPYLTADRWEAIGAFGALDQAWNNVRDIAEDAAAGKCYFPEQELYRFGIDRQVVLDTSYSRGVGWRRFAAWWLSEYLPTLRERARPFLSATDLHPSVEAMRDASLRRYARVERVLRGLDFDYRAFPEAYEGEVKREIGEMAMGSKEITT